MSEPTHKTEVALHGHILMSIGFLIQATSNEPRPVQFMRIKIQPSVERNKFE